MSHRFTDVHKSYFLSENIWRIQFLGSDAKLCIQRSEILPHVFLHFHNYLCCFPLHCVRWGKYYGTLRKYRTIHIFPHGIQIIHRWLRLVFFPKFQRSFIPILDNLVAHYGRRQHDIHEFHHCGGQWKLRELYVQDGCLKSKSKDRHDSGARVNHDWIWS